jgi:type II secretory pathway component PulK
MRKKAQVLIISLWILVILAMLTVGIGHRVSVALRLSRYQKERLKSAYLAKAGINIAINELQKDDPNTDSLKDNWVVDLEKFKKILLGENINEFAAVNSIVDEESKININTAPLELLTELLNSTGAVNPDELANNICAWRGDTGVLIPDYQPLGYNNKGKQFSNAEELMLVKGFTEDIYNSLKEFITVFAQEGESKININTATKEVLEILMNAYVKRLQERNIPMNNPQGLLEAVIDFRNKDGIFTDVNIESGLEGLTGEQKNILNDPVDGLKNKITVKSNYFRIVSEGNISTSKLKHKIECVFDRQNKKIISWHEN